MGSDLPRTSVFAARAWDDLGLDPALLDLVSPATSPVGLASRLRVSELAWDSVAVASLALNLAGDPDRGRVPVALDPDRVRTAYTSERHFRLDGERPTVWAPLSGFWQTGDGWVRVHANYPHHAARLRKLVRLPDPSRIAAERRFRAWSALDLEEAAASAGALVVAVRRPEEWAAHPQAGGRPSSWVDLGRVEGPGPRARTTGTATEPLKGLRVLDLTRVIAGPVAGRTLAVAGADVLRVDPPRLREPQWQHLDSGHGKRSVFLDLRDRHDSATFTELAREADVLLVGYAPDALERLGLDEASVASRFPSLVRGCVRAWSPGGPWASRRGFDSLVQAASGIAWTESDDGSTPGALPAQALDHSTGYVLAAAVATAWRRGLSEGGSWSVSMSLQRCAELLLDAGPAPDRPAPASGMPTTTHLATPLGSLETAASALGLGGGRTEYGSPAGRLGADLPLWR